MAMQETDKERIIREAWGEHWMRVHTDLDENGYIDTLIPTDLNIWEENEKEVDWFDFDTSNKWRPISLKGIENNNGWLCPIEDGLPIVPHCWILLQNGQTFLSVYNNIHKDFTWLDTYLKPDGIVKYRPIKEPPLPFW